MSRLPKSNTILYIEPPITLLSPLKDRTTLSKWVMWFKGLRRLNENIYLYSSPVILPFGNKSRLINKINQWWLSLFVKKVVFRLNLKNPIVWTYMPNSVDLVDKLPVRKLLVYDCVDEHTEYTGLINKALVTEMERQLMNQCDLVFVTAQGLYDTKKDLAREIFFLPNAANVEHFMKAQDPLTFVPKDIAAIPGPIVGFVGVIQDWIDLDLVKDAALAHPEWNFVMIGPVAAGIDTSSLKALPNVIFLGRKNVQDLPSYIKAFDVCINPFKINELTDKVSPLKFYEYLASGKPIVSVNMPGVSDFSDVVEITNNSAEFITGIERAIIGETPEKRQARLNRARENSWDSRAEFMQEKILAKIN
jgi:glycosyltransferase involved in cell wall biosynthesis